MPEQGPRMNGFSLGELCWLFCCPPCPSRIAAKLAFLPPEPTYSVHTDANGTTSLHLTERADWQYSQRELDAVEVFNTRTSRGNRVGCMFVRCAPNSRYTLLFSHGNAVDLGQMCSFYIGLGSRINCNVFSYDYSGYGVSSGKPSEKNLYADIEAAWQVLRNKWVVFVNFSYLHSLCVTQANGVYPSDEPNDPGPWSWAQWLRNNDTTRFTLIFRRSLPFSNSLSP